MLRRIIFFSLGLTVGFLNLQIAHAREKSTFTPLGVNQYVSSPSLARAPTSCTLKKHNDTVSGYWSGYADGIRTVTYFDPAACGGSIYPFEIQALSFTLYDPGGYQWPVTVDVVVYDRPNSGDPCDGPGSELCRFTISCDSATWAFPNVGTAWFPAVCCVNRPFFIGIEYNDAGAGPFPSVLFSNQDPTDTCDNWQYYTDGFWYEWSDFWVPPRPGYPIYWVDGETESLNCGELVKINEIKPYAHPMVDDDGQYDYSFVELFNAGASPQDLTGWELTNVGKTTIASLPSVVLPGGAFFKVNFGIGTDDLDFSDGYGEMFTGGDSVVFPDTGDAAALYDQTVAVVDFVIWASAGATPAGSALSDAVAAGIWSSGAVLEYAPENEFSTYGLCPDGLDHNDTSDWREFTWSDYLWWPGPENPIQISPLDGGVLEEVSNTLTWGGVAFADSYFVELDDDSLLVSPAFALVSTDTSATVPGVLPEGIYYWRVRVFEGGILSPRFVRYEVVNIDISSTERDKKVLAVPHLIQHKDTRLLCIWNLRATDGDERPGCDEAAGSNGPWDSAHATSRAHVRGCEHCSWYCSRASIAMINNFKEGDLSQDRISYELWFNANAGRPEGDLGHNRGTLKGASGGAHGNGGRWQILEWAVGAAVTYHAGAPSLATIKSEIDNDRPIYVSTGRHASVLVGYDEFAPGLMIVKINDPWPGNPSWRGRRAWTGTIAYHFRLPAAGINARKQEGTVTADSDGDGIRDFDEGLPGYPADRPRRFHAKFNEADSDSDEVADKNEIKNYTFHDKAGFDPGHDNDDINFPDVDNDNLRAEHDCDSDNDGDFDGGEDIDGDGHNPVPPPGNVCLTETCQFKPGQKCIKVAVDKDVYMLGEPVYIVDQHFTRETHTYHKNSQYHYELGDGCPAKPDSSNIRWDGTFSVDAGGHAKKKKVMDCWFPGEYYLYVDVLSDHHYNEPDNWDPWTCWICEGYWFHGWHWGYDYYPYHNPDYPWPKYDYPSICIFEEDSVVTYVIECPWWWWCYEWPPVLTDYWLGVAIPTDLIESGNVMINRPPALTFESPDCSGTPVNWYVHSESVELDLMENFGDSDIVWFGYEIPDWQIPDSQMTTRVEIDVLTGYLKNLTGDPVVKIMAGDTVYGWSPTVYDSIPLPGLGACCNHDGMRGDVNYDLSGPNVADLTYLVDYLFRGGTAPPCFEEGDVDGDGSINVADLTYLVDFLFRGGPAPQPCP